MILEAAFYAYQAATGGQIDTMIGLMRFSEDQYKALRSLYFKINDVTYELTPNAQIWPVRRRSKSPRFIRLANDS